MLQHCPFQLQGCPLPILLSHVANGWLCAPQGYHHPCKPIKTTGLPPSLQAYIDHRATISKHRNERCISTNSWDYQYLTMSLHVTGCQHYHTLHVSNIPITHYGFAKIAYCIHPLQGCQLPMAPTETTGLPTSETATTEAGLSTFSTATTGCIVTRHQVLLPIYSTVNTDQMAANTHIMHRPLDSQQAILSTRTTQLPTSNTVPTLPTTHCSALHIPINIKPSIIQEGYQH